MAADRSDEDFPSYSNSLDEVSRFFKEIGVRPDVIARFSREKVDKEALSLMSEKEMEEMGLMKGDRLKISSFVRRNGKSDIEKNNVETRLKRLKSLLQGRGTKRSHTGETAQIKKNEARKSSLKIEFGWKHFCQKTNRYVQKKKNNGGGTRTVDVNKEATVEECLKIAKDLFFPEGQSPVGKASDMMMDIGNYNGVQLEADVLFTAQKYKVSTGFHSPRLYLLTKLLEDLFYDTSSDDGELAKSVFPVTEREERFLYSDGLIGTSVERQTFFDDLQKEVDASIASDKEKQKTKLQLQTEVEKAKEEAAALEDLRRSRELRVYDEPHKGEPHVVVSVRHISLGRITRKFRPSAEMLAVYDWVGSRVSLPRHFSLSVKPGNIIYPDESLENVKGYTLCMIKEDAPVQLSEDDNEIRLFDGQSTEGDVEDTVVVIDDKRDFQDKDTTKEQDYKADAIVRALSIDNVPLLPISEQPPSQLLQEDEGEPLEVKDLESCKGAIEEKRQKQKATLDGCEYVIVSRHDIIKDLINLYQNADMLLKNVDFSFKDEYGSGDGVQREVYSEFWDSFVQQYCEGSSQFALCISPALQTEDYTSLGRIITHQFVQLGSFPLQIAEAQVQQVICNEVTDYCLLNTFLKLLPEKESDTVMSAIVGEKSFPINDVIDILSSFGSTTLPTKYNIRKIIVDTARSELICKPYLALMKLKEGMGHFWSSFNCKELSALYALSTPTSANVISSLQCSPCDNDEQRVYTWLCRYINSIDGRMLRRFLRFCTATDIVLPGVSIAVRFENMLEIAMRPLARTCFGVLTLPKNYQRFTQMRGQLDYYLQNKELWDLED